MIVLIGGSGFIGSNLASKLKKKKKSFKILDINVNPKFEYCTKIVDILDKSSLIKNIPAHSVIINLAAIHRDDEKKDDYYLVNVNGSRNICEVAELKNCKKIIFFSSVAVYGFAKPFADESCFKNPYNHYGNSKKKAEKIYLNWNKKNKNNKLVIIRPTAVFGPGNRGNIFNLINQIYKGPFFMIGNARNVKSIAYIENVTDFTIYLLSFTKKKVICNYVDEPQLSLNELIIFIRKELKIENKLIRIPYPVIFFVASIFDFISFIFNKKFKISRIRVRKFITDSSYRSNCNGFLANFSLKDGLRRTIKKQFNV